mmetsp:Transcript_42929/g.86789  ORF Transcript_42929/g.86789 Transcript_42929/m.86789 type:complete len:753 (+) Transcript_42929:72-2330(+)
MADATLLAPAPKVKPAPPPPTPAIMAAAVVIRGALAGVLGQKLGGTCSAVMPILSDPGVAKMTISIKGCAREAELKGGDAALHEAVLRSAEAAANAMIASDLPIIVLPFPDKTAAAAAFGGRATATDEGPSGKEAEKAKKAMEKALKAAAATEAEGGGTQPPLVETPGADVLCIAGLAAVCNATKGFVCARTGVLGGVTFEVLPGKDAKKASLVDVGKPLKVIVKFAVLNPDAAAPFAKAALTRGAGADADAAVLIAGLVAADVEEVRDERTKALMAEARAGKEAQVAAEAAATKEQEAATAAAATAAAAGDGSAAEAEEQEMVVDPWTVSGKIDYGKLIDQFGSVKIDQALLARMEKIAVGSGRVKALHPFLRRNIFFSHRDLSAICDAAESRERKVQELAAAAAESSSSSGGGGNAPPPPPPPPFYLYTGRGPSSAAMHLGHLVPFLMTQWLQQAFDVPLVVQMTDDEKFLWKGEYDADTGTDNLLHYHSLATENAKDIIACGFDKAKTFIFTDLDYIGYMYPNVVRIWKAVTYSQAKGCFGFEGHSNIGQSAFPGIQAAPSFPSSFPVPLQGHDCLPCLIPCAIDQDPYFRITRDIAHKLVPPSHPLKGKPSLVHSKFFPPLQGAQGKMSSSSETSAVFLTDSPAEICDKIKTHAFSGGQETKAKQQELGADLETDVAYQWLSFFLEDDDELAAIGESYRSGKGAYWSTGLVKERLIVLLQEMVAKHQARRALVTDAEVGEWMAVRPIL